MTGWVPPGLPDGGMLYADVLSPWDAWPDKEIIRWAQTHKLTRYPIAHAPLMTADRDGPNTVTIDWTVRPPKVTRHRDETFDRFKNWNPQ